MKNLYAVIIAGGSGERFWPMSRAGSPKQFLSFSGGRTMLEAAAERVSPVIPPERVFVCTGADFTERVRELCPGIPAGNIIAEPFGRNTAAACGLSALKVGLADRSAVMAVLPADHVIREEGLFRKDLLAAASAAESLGVLVVFGVEPDRPATGYGYIKAGEPVPGTPGAFRVEGFMEKPGRETAEKFIESGSFFWNSGMFVWTFDSIMSEIKALMPGLYEGLERIGNDPGSIEEVYRGLPGISVDYGIMEKTRNVVMIRSGFGWSDIGSWDALERILPADPEGNAVAAEHFRGVDSSGNVVASDDTLVAAVGVKDLVIAVSGGAVLVCRKDMAQDVKKIVGELKKDRKLRRFVL